jgi:hypothetical protein
MRKYVFGIALVMVFISPTLFIEISKFFWSHTTTGALQMLVILFLPVVIGGLLGTRLTKKT